MKTPLTGVLPPSPLQRLKTWITLTYNTKAQQAHTEKAAEQLAEVVAKECRVY